MIIIIVGFVNHKIVETIVYNALHIKVLANVMVVNQIIFYKTMIAIHVIMINVMQWRIVIAYLVK